MTLFSPILLAAGLLLTTHAPLLTAATQNPPAAPLTSPAFGQIFMDAQKALQEKRWEDVIDKAKQVLADGRRRPDDTYAAYYFMLEAHKGRKDGAGLREAIRGMLASGFPISAEDRASLNRRLETPDPR